MKLEFFQDKHKNNQSFEKEIIPPQNNHKKNISTKPEPTN